MGVKISKIYSGEKASPVQGAPESLLFTKNGEQVPVESANTNQSDYINPQGPVAETILSYGEPVKIEQPAANTVHAINIQEGTNYILDFPREVVETVFRDGDKTTITFTNGATLILQKIIGSDGEYDFSQFEGETAQFISALELSAIEEENAVKELAQQEELQAELRKLNLEELFAKTATNDDEVSAIRLAAVEPAAGLTATDAAGIEPAAGEGAIDGSSGYGFQSSYTSTEFTSINDVGPINPTSLQYGTPLATDDIFPQLAAATGPTFPQLSGGGQDVDEGNLAPTVIANGQSTVDFGPNTPGTLTLGNASTFRATGSIDNGVLSSRGDAITVAVVGNTATGTANGRQVFQIVLNNDGTYTFTLSDVLDHADPNDPNDVISLFFGVSATDSTGDTVSSEITINVADDAPVAVNDVNNAPNSTTVNGNVLTNDDGGVDTPATLTQVTFNGVTTQVPAGGSVLINGGFGSLTIGSDGAYSYTANAVGSGADVFTYTLTDFDGDSDTATLAIAAGTDVSPIVTNPAAQSVDESNLNGGANTQSVSGTVVVDYGVNAPGAVTAAGTNTVSFTGAANNALTSGGNPVTVTLSGNTYTGTANGQTVFTLAVQSDGQFTFNLVGTLDHANTADPNDTLQITFGVNATDVDGDATAGTITINILDDGPVAVNDADSVVAGNTTTGNIITNDDVGEDTSGSITNVNFNGVDTNVPQGGQAVINGNFGTLTINSNGSFSYASNGGANGTDQFTYTLQDADGDAATARLDIAVSPAAAPVFIVGTNTNDVSGSATAHEVGGGSGVINGNNAGDILIGDTGGATAQNQGPNYNFVLMLDVSGSMGDVNDPNSKIQLLKAAVNNLMGDLNAYNGGQINVHIVPFSNNPVRPTGTFTVTDAQGFTDAQNFVNALVPGGLTNYEQPMQTAISYYNSGAAIAGATNVTYFISDDEPNRYVDPNGNFERASDTIIMGEVTGTDGTDEVGTLQGFGQVIAVGIDLGADIDNLHLIDSSGTATDVQNPSDLSAVLQAANPVIQLGSVGGDTINGGDGADIIYGDSVYTDALATAEGLNTNPGDGWTVYEQLENGQGNTTPGWARADTIQHIQNNSVALSQESVNSQNQTRSGGNDVINGGAGNDTIFGQEGRDFITGGDGADTLYGGSGNDVFVYTANTGDVDTIRDFSAAQGDQIDISSLLVGYDPLQDSINNFVFATVNGNNTTISVDANGTGNVANAFAVAVLENAIGLNIQTITNNGETIN